MKTFWLLASMAILSTAALLAACGPGATTTPTTTPPTTTVATTPTQTQAAFTVKTASKAGVGDYVVDGNGMTLYYFAKDSIGKSNASATVLASWPVFNAQNIVAPSNLNAADFATITRDDGSKQTTYKGWPLYYYAKDKAAGDTLGEGVGGIWFVIKVPFYTVMIENKADVGNYLVDARGMALYYFAKDSVGKSNATSAIIQTWPVFLPGSFVVPSTTNTTDFGSITRDDGAKQATYKGWPLYYYSKDQKSGDTLGQGFNGIWYVVNPANFPPTPTPTTTPAATTTSSAPSVTITSPTNGASVSAGSLTVTVQVANFTVVDKQGQAAVPGEGHAHFYLDVAAPTAPGQPAVPASGVWAHVSGTTYTFTNVAAGAHTIAVQLVNNDHTPVIPLVVAQINVTVTAASGGGGY